MPAAPVAPPPSSPAAAPSPNSAAQAAPKASPAPTVGQQTHPELAGATKTPPYVPGASRAKVSEMLKASATLNSDGSDIVKGPKPASLAPTKPESAPIPDPAKIAGQDKPAVPAETKANEAAPVDEVKGVTAEERKLGPWQLKAKWEKTAKALEAENADLRKKAAGLADVESLKERSKKAESRAQELEESIRFIDYSKSNEFKEKYQAPYEQAWAKAAADLREIIVTDSEGNRRAANSNDLMQLANMPLQEARELADEKFGKLADEVMAHRRAVRELAEKQQTALEDARKNGSEREKQRSSQLQEIAETNNTHWATFNQEDEQKYEFLKPKEGDDAWNSKLAASKQFVDSAFSASSSNPSLTPEQRAQIIRDHASIRGRAIGFSMLKVENTSLRSQIAALNKTIAEFKQSEPTSGNGGTAGAVEGGATSAMERAHARIRSFATRSR